jgi:hypothetical protein
MSAAAYCAAFAAKTAWGQVPAPLLQPVDQSVEDTSPLSASLRETQVDLRQPSGFQQVYRVPGRDDLYMRISGGLIAVFPQSVYSRQRGGQRPLIPPGTMFYIGSPATVFGISPQQQPSHADEVSSRVDLRVDPYAPPDAGQIAASTDMLHGGPHDLLRGAVHTRPAPAGPTIVGDPEYRARRIDQLLQQAVAAHLKRFASEQTDAH